MKLLLSNPRSVFTATLLISALSLATAYIAQIHYDLAPCQLCIYQRVPFAVAIVFSLAGLIFLKNPRISIGLIALNALAFAANTVIAIYHSGVERHWWKSALDGCEVSFESKTEALLETIMSAQAARCDEIPWADPVLGFSMANYNALLCTVVCVLLMYSFITLYRTRSARP